MSIGNIYLLSDIVGVSFYVARAFYQLTTVTNNRRYNQMCYDFRKICLRMKNKTLQNMCTDHSLLALDLQHDLMLEAFDE